MAVSKELTLVDCPNCPGTKPVILEFTPVMSKDKLYVYKCPTCNLKGEMSWPTNGEITIKSWNHTIKTMVEHVSYKKT